MENDQIRLPVVPPSGSPDAIRTYLNGFQEASLQRLVALAQWLRKDGMYVRHSAQEWFWSGRFSPMHVYSGPIPEALVNILNECGSNGNVTRQVTRRISGDWKFLHNTSARDSVLQLLFVYGILDPRPASYVDDFLISHPDGAVRSVAVGVLSMFSNQDWARRRLIRLTHDTDDRVFLQAFRAIGMMRIKEALPELFHIVVKPSGLVHMAHAGCSANPVGLGGAHVLISVLQVIGTDQIDIVRNVENVVPLDAGLSSERFETMHRLLTERKRKYDRPLTPKGKLDLHFISVPRGRGTVGVHLWEMPPGRFKHTNVPRRAVNLAPYQISRDPITNEVYDNFVKEFTRYGSPEYEHPAQEPGKDHSRTTFGDRRFGPDHPVAGVDWFDIFSFCQFYGLRLPTEDEWEFAVTKGEYVLPSSDTAQGFNHTYKSAGGIFSWAASLNETTETFPAVTTSPIDDSVVHGFGLRHALGNVWEYTDTNWYTRKTLCVPDIPLKPEQFMSLYPYHAVIKGGAWTSIDDLLSSYYRGFDLLSDRHCEIGFRVAKE